MSNCIHCPKGKHTWERIFSADPLFRDTSRLKADVLTVYSPLVCVCVRVWLVVAFFRRKGSGPSHGWSLVGPEKYICF